MCKGLPLRSLFMLLALHNRVEFLLVCCRRQRGNLSFQCIFPRNQSSISQSKRNHGVLLGHTSHEDTNMHLSVSFSVQYLVCFLSICLMVFFFLPVLATSHSKKFIIFVSSWKILEKLPSKSFSNCYQGIMGKGDIESFTFHSFALRSSKLMVLRLGWGSAVGSQ